MAKTKLALYEVMGLSVEATDTEITRAYRRLALQYHPDRNPDGAEQFKAISNAYAVLGDAEKRALYDATGIIPGSEFASDDGNGLSPQERAEDMGRRVHAFYEKYAGSPEEMEDLEKGYRKCAGNFRKMVREYLLFDNGKDGEVRRLYALAKARVEAGALPVTEAWSRTTLPKVLKRIERDLLSERAEAEEALAAMGLDKDGMATSASPTEGGGGLGALQVLMKQREKAAYETMMHNLEAKYVSNPEKKRRLREQEEEAAEEELGTAQTQKKKKRSRHG